jgi:acylpyruvate hydrolase
MRFVSYCASGVLYAGVLDGSDVTAVGEGGVGELVRRGGLPSVRPAGESLPLSSVQLLPPVPQPGKIVCLGLNYRAHADEAGMEAPGVPTFFAKWANALAAPGASVALPAWSSKVD